MMVRARDRDDDDTLPSPAAVAEEVIATFERQTLINQSVRHRARLVRLMAVGSPEEQDQETQRLAARLNTPRARCVVLDAIPAIVGTDETSFAVRFDDDGEGCQVYRSELDLSEELSPDEWRAVQLARAKTRDR